MPYWKKERLNELASNRPRIDKQRLAPKAKRRRGYDYIHLIRASILSGLLKEAKYSNSTIKLYALLTMEAILADMPVSDQRRFQKELDEAGFTLTYVEDGV